MSLSKLMKRSHLGATRVTGYALTLGGYDAWEAASAVWEARLTAAERAALSWAAMKSLDHDDAMKVAETALGGAGAPLPPFLNPVDEAQFWASIASPQELDACALACTRAMAPGRRTAFLGYMSERKAA